jgi:hypothetical protein
LTPQSFIARNAGAPYQFGNGFCWFWPRGTNTTTVASTAGHPWEINWSGNAHQIKSFFAEPTPEQNLFSSKNQPDAVPIGSIFYLHGKELGS